MMRVGTAFTYLNRRFESGDRFDLTAVPAYLHGTLTRMYGLAPWRKPSLRKDHNEL